MNIQFTRNDGTHRAGDVFNCPPIEVMDYLILRRTATCLIDCPPQTLAPFVVPAEYLLTDAPPLSHWRLQIP